MRRGILAGVIVLLVATTWSLVGALRAPGDDDASVKLAEWARDHGLGPVVTAAEAVQYRLNPPQSGGTPDSSEVASGAAQNAKAGRKPTPGIAVVPLQPRLTTPVTDVCAAASESRTSDSSALRA